MFLSCAIRPGNEGTAIIPVSGKYWWAGFCLLLVLTVFLFFFRLGTPDFWTDEVLSQVKYDSLSDNLRQIAKDVHPPVYFIASWWWKKLWNPTTEAGLRSFSALVGAGCVLLTVWLGTRLLHRNFGLLAGLVVALSPFFLQYSRMHRYYSTIAFWVLLSLVFLFYRGEKNVWWGIRCGLANLGLIYTNYVGAIFILGQAAIVPLVYPRAPRVWGRWLTGQIVLAAGFLPWAWIMLRQAERGNIAYQVAKSSPPVLLAAIAALKGVCLKLLYSGYVFWVGETTFPWQIAVTIPAAMVAGAAIIMLFGARRPEARNFRILLVYAVGVLLIVVTMSVIYTRVFSFQSFALLPSRLLPLVPITSVAMLFGLWSVRRRWLTATLITMLILTEAFGTIHYFAQDQYLNPKYNVSWKQAVRFVTENSGSASFACTDESSYLYYNRELKGPPAYGVMDLDQGFRERGVGVDSLTLWVISRYRGDPGIRLAYQELESFCSEYFEVVTDTSFGRLNPKLGHSLTRMTGDAAPDRILRATQYAVSMRTGGIEAVERAMTEFMDAKPDRWQILGWIKNEPALPPAARKSESP